MTKVNYNLMKDIEIRDLLFERKIEIPLDETKALIRKHAVKLLMDHDEANRPLSDFPKMRVMFHRTGTAGEANYVFLSLNGYTYQIPYEKEVELPEPVIRGCVDNAVRVEYILKDANADAGHGAEYEERVIKTVPYTFLGYAEDKSAKKAVKVEAELAEAA